LRHWRYTARLIAAPPFAGKSFVVTRQVAAGSIGVPFSAMLETRELQSGPPAADTSGGGCGRMLRWVAYGAMAALVVVALRWYLRRFDALGRRRPFPWLGVTLLAVLAAGCGLPVVLHERLEHRLSRAASSLVGFDVIVNCQTFGQSFVDAGAELGYVRYGPDGTPEHATLIKKDQCDDLKRYLRSGKASPSIDEVIAVHILTHESMHMSGHTDEAVAECAAVQRDARVAQLLGASAPEAAALALRYWREVYPGLPEGYVSTDCRPGGELDERLAGAPWVGA
jgi:hypothetical protein